MGKAATIQENGARARSRGMGGQAAEGRALLGLQLPPSQRRLFVYSEVTSLLKMALFELFSVPPSRHLLLVSHMWRLHIKHGAAAACAGRGSVVT